MAASTVGKALALSKVSPHGQSNSGANSAFACKYWAAVGGSRRVPFSLSRSGPGLSD